MTLVTFGGAAWTFPQGLRRERHVVNVLDWMVAMPFGQGYRTFNMVPGDTADATLFVQGWLGHDFRRYWSVYWKQNSPAARRRREQRHRQSLEDVTRRTVNGLGHSTIQ